LEANISSNESRKESAVLFTLRILSGGSDLDSARELLRIEGNYLPSCLADHPDILDFIRVSEESPSSLHVISGYSEASRYTSNHENYTNSNCWNRKLSFSWCHLSYS
jgi:hypothetical protein